MTDKKSGWETAAESCSNAQGQTKAARRCYKDSAPTLRTANGFRKPSRTNIPAPPSCGTVPGLPPAPHPAPGARRGRSGAERSIPAAARQRRGERVTKDFLRSAHKQLFVLSEVRDFCPRVSPPLARRRLPGTPPAAAAAAGASTAGAPRAPALGERVVGERGATEGRSTVRTIGAPGNAPD